MMKRICVGLFLLVVCLLCIGCDNKTNYDLEFDEKMILDLNSNDQPITLIKKIDGKKITSKMIDDNKKVVYKNYVIECMTKIDTSKTGVYEVIYATNDVENKQIKKKIYVKDISKPQIKLKEKKIEKYIDEVGMINYYDYFEVNDNSGTDNIDIIIDDKGVKESSGTYTVKFVVEDSSGNKNEKKIKLILKERPIEKSEPEIPDEEKRDSKSTDVNDKKLYISPPDNRNNDSSKSQNKSQSNSQNKKTDSKKYNKFFVGNTIDIYNQAYEYAESIFNGGSVNGYTINPTGEGFQVEFN